MSELNEAFKGDNSGGYFDRERKANPLTFDKDGEPIDPGFPEDDYDQSAPGYIVDC